MSDNLDARLDRLASNAADRALKSMSSSGVSYESPSFGSYSTENEEIESGEAIAAFDIFDWCDETTKKGHQIQYVVKRNGEMLAIKYHPYSWEQIQKEYKGGQYQIVAKSLTTKKYLKSETRTLSDPLKTSDDSEEIAQKIMMQAPPQQQGPNFMELFTLFQSMNEKQRAEARESAKETAQMGQQNMLAFVEMMKSSQTGSQQMFFEIAKMTQQVSEKLAESQRAMFEKMETRFEKILDKVSEKTSPKTDKPEFGLLELMKMQQESQEKGFQLFNQLSQIAETKAAERVEMMEELRGEQTPAAPAKEKSMTDTLIETMLPTIAGALAGSQAVPPTQQAVQPVRRALPPQQIGQVRQVPRQVQPTQPGATAQRTQVQANRADQTQANAQKSAASRSVSGQTSGQPTVKRNALGLPTAEIPVKTAETPVVTVQAAAETPKTTDLKAKFTEILVPVLGESLLGGVSPEEGATATIAALEKSGHTRVEFVENVSLPDLMAVVSGFNLPEEANPWFEGLYAHLQNTAGVDAREHAPSV